jgi:hypothetical protein
MNIFSPVFDFSPLKLKNYGIFRLGFLTRFSIFFTPTPLNSPLVSIHNNSFYRYLRVCEFCKVSFGRLFDLLFAPASEPGTMNKLSSAKSAMILSLSAVSQALACLSTICLILWSTGSDSGNGIVIEISGKLAEAVGKLLAIAMSDMQPNP